MLPFCVNNPIQQKSIARLRRLLKSGGGSGDGREGGEAGGQESTAGINYFATAGTNKQSKSTFKSRADSINSRGVQAALTNLGAIGRDLGAEREWASDSEKPNGGVHEFRSSVFEKRLDGLFRRCEEAHEEASAASEAYLLLLDKGR